MGLDIGLEKTGRFGTVCAVEVEEGYVNTILKNKSAGNLVNKNIKVLRKDLHVYEPTELMSELGISPGEVDLLTGGPPCQSFSTAGKRGTMQDQRGLLTDRFLDFVHALRPKMFLMENVRGLMSAGIRHRPIAERPKNGGPPLTPEEEPGSVIRRFIEKTDDDYRIDCFEVNSVNYGAPQVRERVLLIGNRYGLKVNFPQPTHYSPNKLEDFPDSKPHCTLGSVISDLQNNNDEVLDFSPRKKEFLRLVPEGGNWRSIPEEKAKEIMKRAFFAKGGRSGWLRRLSFDLPAPTILTMPNHASTALCHPEETRALSLRECARIQGFPDEWVFDGTLQEKYAQVGNAVPIRLGEVAGDVMADYLDLILANHSSEIEDEKLSYPKFTKEYINSHVRVRNWYKNGQAVVR